MTEKKSLCLAAVLAMSATFSPKASDLLSEAQVQKTAQASEFSTNGFNSCDICRNCDFTCGTCSGP